MAHRQYEFELIFGGLLLIPHLGGFSCCFESRRAWKQAHGCNCPIFCFFGRMTLLSKCEGIDDPRGEETCPKFGLQVGLAIFLNNRGETS